jgi:osmotically-inducible protein OsmY
MMLTIKQRADSAIAEDIRRIIQDYPPAVNDRHRIHYSVQDGVITLSGYVRSYPTFIYLLNRIEAIRGIQGIVADEFYNDEYLRREVGQVVPSGVQVRVEYGTVALTGTLPEDADVESVVRQVGLVDGVHRVLTTFSA